MEVSKAALLCIFASLAVLRSSAIAAEKAVPLGNPDAVPAPKQQFKLPQTTLGPGVGPNVRCNNRVTCNDGRGVVQSETALAISGDVVVCGYNDFRAQYCPNQDPGYQWVGWAYSLDGGATFIDGGPLPGRTLHRGDPWLATGPDGTIYYVDIWNNLAGMAALRGGVVTENGISWSEPTVIATSGSFDKEAMAIDQVTGSIYLTYTRFGGPGGIWLHKSDDGGLTFDAGQPVGLSGTGSYPAIGPNGEVYIVSQAGSNVVFTRSLDGAQTFSSPRNIGAVSSFSVPGLNRHSQFPQVAVDTSGGPNTGNIYAVWDTFVGGNGNAVIVTSTDGGDTWSSPMLVNDDTPGLHFYPTVSVDSLGRVNVFFYDRREDPGTRVTNLYFAQSSDGGASFDPNIRVTDTASLWTDPGEGSPNYGDYINSVSVGTKACVAYADGRDGDPDAYFTCVDL
ncbi:MAG TPA: sialidase family protein [Myxococcaceae bacterium]|nr:sialidase family protein [Myxococcaceae bacterium]